MTIRTITLAGLLSLVSGAAAAHPGDHGGLELSALAAHFVQEPFHAGLLLAAGVLAGLAFRRWRKARLGARGK